MAGALMIHDILDANALQDALGCKYLVTLTNLLGGIKARLNLNRKNSELTWTAEVRGLCGSPGSPLH